MRSYTYLTFLLVFSLVGLSLHSCQKLDKNGGYYDEETQTYKYVRPTHRGVQKSALQVVSPTPGKSQQIYGIVTRIGDDAKSIWLKIEDRHPYMILAERLSGGNRDDKNKELRITLKNVSPLGSATRKGEFRQQWKDYVVGMLANQIVNKQVLVEIEYEEISRKLWGTCYIIVDTSEGDRARNINLWMVQQGLSFYFIGRGQALDDKKFREAQNLARKYKSGIWKYQ